MLTIRERFSVLVTICLVGIGCTLTIVYHVSEDSYSQMTQPKDHRALFGHLFIKGARNRTNGEWLSLGMNYPREGYIYTAFYDDRESLGSFPIIRLIAVLEKAEKEMIYCSMYYNRTGLFEHVVAEYHHIGKGLLRHGKYFREYVLACPLNDTHVPDGVGIVSDPQLNPSGLIAVEIPPDPELKQSDFGVCVSVTFGKINYVRVVEWMELMRILGVSGVTLYNNSIEQESAEIFKVYEAASEGFVDFRQSHNFMADPGLATILLHMSPVINDCMYRNMYKYKKIVVVDLDEIIVPRTVDTLKEMLLLIDKKQGGLAKHTARNYIFRNNYFFLDIPGEDQLQSSNTITLRHRKKAAISPPMYSVKSIIDPQACIEMHNHKCLRVTPKHDRLGGTIYVEPEFGLNQHYKMCHFNATECKKMMQNVTQDDTMLRYKSRLENAINEKLAELGWSKE